LRKWEIYFRGEKSNDTTTSKRRQKENAGENLLAGCRLLFSRSLFCASQFHSIVYIFLCFFFAQRKHIFKVNQTKIEREKRSGGRQHNVCLLKQNETSKKIEKHT